MARKPKKHNAGSDIGANSISNSNSQMQMRARKNLALASALKFTALTVLFLLAHHLFELTETGEHFKQFEAELLLSVLNFTRDTPPLPIIVNISEARQPFGTTDRALLDGLIAKLDEKRVKAIGIDIDFSPLDDGSPVTRDDWNYFDQWLKRSARSQDPMKIHLGVHRRATDDPPSWLGRKDFEELAVGIARPADDPGRSFAHVVPVRDAGPLRELPQIAIALLRDSSDKDKEFKWKEEDYGSLHTAVYRVNYSSKLLEALARETIDYKGPDDLDIAERTKRIEFRGRIVIIGDATGFEDQFCRPFSATPTAGAVAHAASLVTLRQGGLREVDTKTTVALDMAIAGAGFLFLLSFPRVARMMWATTDWKAVHAENAEKLYCIFGSILIGCLSAVLVVRNGEFWPDFLWTSLALFVHPFVSETMFPFLSWIWNDGIRRLFTSTPDGAADEA